MEEPADKTRMFRTLLKGQALSYYFSEENPKQSDQDEIIEILDQAKLGVLNGMKQW
jgi:hypothetical protein